MHNVNPTTHRHQENPSWETLQRQLTCHLPKVQGQESQRKSGEQFQTRVSETGSQNFVCGSQWVLKKRVQTRQGLGARIAGGREQFRVWSGEEGVCHPLAPPGSAWHSRYLSHLLYFVRIGRGLLSSLPTAQLGHARYFSCHCGLKDVVQEPARPDPGSERPGRAAQTGVGRSGPGGDRCARRERWWTLGRRMCEDPAHLFWNSWLTFTIVRCLKICDLNKLLAVWWWKNNPFLLSVSQYFYPIEYKSWHTLELVSNALLPHTCSIVVHMFFHICKEAWFGLESNIFVFLKIEISLWLRK